MDLCNEKHDEICYEGRVCPACDKIGDLEVELEDVQEQLKKAQSELDAIEE